MIKRISRRVISLLLVIVMLAGVIPMNTMAAPNADINEEMLDNVFLDALAYTGYDVNAQKNDGTIFVLYGSKVSSAIRTNITYGTGPSGLETIASGNTATGLAPDISKYEANGLCCASYVSYVYYNYLPNIAGIDTSSIPCPSNPRLAAAYDEAGTEWVNSGNARRINFTQNYDGSGFTPSEEIPIGSLVVFKAVGGTRISHVALYAGYYNGLNFVTHVGDDNGPGFSTIEGMAKGTASQVVVQIVAPNIVESEGVIEVIKKDTDGNKLSGAVFVATSVKDSSKQYVIGPTDKNGYACTLEGIPYGDYIVKETVFPTNYKSNGTNEWRVTVDKNNNGKVTINAVNEIITGSCKIVKTSEDGTVSNIEFKIEGNGVNKNVKTGSNGEITIDNLKPGKYTITEVVADKYEPQEVRTVTVVSGNTATVNFNNVLKRGSLKVIKTSEDKFVEGMEFKLTGTSVSGAKIEQYAVTDKNGVAVFNDVLISGNTPYTIEEINTPDRYVIPEAKDVVIKWNEVTEVKFNNILKKWRADVFKLDSDIVRENAIKNTLVKESDLKSDELVNKYGTPFGKTQADASLEGAVYGVYKNGELVDTYTTDKNGYFITKYYPCGDNNKWTIKEITPSKGYLLDDTIYAIGADPKDYKVELNTKYLNVYEDVIKGKIAIIKHCDDGSTKIETPEKGATFQVYLKSAGSFEKAKDTERDIIVCDKDGFGETINLPFGVYVVEQTKGLEGKALMPAFEVNICEDEKTYKYLINNATFESEIEIVKKDIETGKLIPVSGVGFKVRNIDTGEYVVQHINYPTPMDVEVYYTDETGKLMLPDSLGYGNYEIIEQCTAYGYVLDSTPVAFKVDGSKSLITVEKHNISQKGIITVNKSGEVFSSVILEDNLYKPVYAVQGLEGAVYEIIAKEDIITPEETVRYKKGEVVDTITTNVRGEATSKELYLGEYDIREIKAPFGMVINNEVVSVELKYAGETVAVTDTSASFINERQRIEINLKKTLEQDEKFNIGLADEITNVRFGLFAAEDIVAADETFIPKDGLIEMASCDLDGNITFTSDLPVNSKVYVKEIETDNCYILSDEIYEINFEYQGQENSKVIISVNGEEEIENEIIRGSILGKKLDEDGFSICGALFGLFNENETVFTKDTALMTCTSNEIGVFYFEDVPFGRWIIREIKAKDGFVLNENSYAVTITEDEEVIEIVIENEFITGTVKTTKVDEEYPKNKLTGATFEVYADVDNNKEYDADIDLYVGEMTETETGIYEMKDLRFGGYFLYESKAPKGFIKDDGYYYFSIEEDGKEVVVENKAGVGFINKPITGTLELTKTDVADGKLLKNAGFRIKDEDGNVVVEGYTDENGVVKFSLRFGKYTYEEFDAPEGYLIDTTPKEFEIKENGEIIKAVMTNEKEPVIKAPQTGDKNNFGFFIGLGAVAIGGIVAMVVINIKRKKEESEI